MKTGLVLFAFLILAIMSLASGFGPYRLCQGFVDLVGDKLDWRARSLAGKEGVNCGRVESGHDARAANDCVKNSLALGKAFRVRYDVQAIEGSLYAGLVRSQQGRTFEIILDDKSSRGAPSLFRQQVAVEECTTELRVTHGGRLTCTPDRGY
jgi:hypothetical protein